MKPSLTMALFVCALFGCAWLAAVPSAAAAELDPWEVLADAATNTDPAATRKQLETLLLDHPDFHPGHFNLGSLLIESDPEAAVSHLEAATASPQAELAADAWHNLALARWHQGRLEDAVAAAGKLVALRPDNAEAQRLQSELRRVFIARQDEARRNAEAEAKKLHLGETALPPAHVGEAYDHALVAAGGSAPYRFSLGAMPAAGTSTGTAPTPPTIAVPPPGLALDDEGHLRGTPTKAGRYDLVIALKDHADATVTGTLTLAVLPAPEIITERLPEAVRGSAYAAGLDCVGLANPTWRIDGLPEGLALEGGRGDHLGLTGTPHQAGAFAIQVRADDGQRHAEKQMTITVSDLFAPMESTLPPATAWSSYQHRLEVRGPAQIYHWQAAPSGGVSIADDGTASGTPDKAGTFIITATITAEDGRTRKADLTLPVNPPPVIQESAPIALTQGEPVARPLAVAGGTPPYAWRLAEGALPKGLRLDADGSLRGVSTERGETKVTVALADHWQSRTQQAITITVKPTDKHPEKKEEQKEEQKDKQDPKGQKDPAPSDEAKKPQDQQEQRHDQSTAKDQKPEKPGAGDQSGKNPPQQPSADQAKHEPPQASGEDKQTAGQAGGEHQRSAAEIAAQQAQALNQAAAERWLDQLPRDDRRVLRYQLLDAGEKQPRAKGGKTW